MRQAVKITRSLSPDVAKPRVVKPIHKAKASLADALIAGGAVQAVRSTTAQKSLREVFAGLKNLQVQLNVLDDQIGEAIRTIEFHMRRTIGVTKILKTTLDDGATLGWSCRRGYWRFVIVDAHEDGVTTDLLATSREERAEVFTSGAMERIVHQAQALVSRR